MGEFFKIFFSIPGAFSIAFSAVRFSKGYSWEDIAYILGGMLISTISLSLTQHFETKKTQLILENNSNQLHHIGTTISHLANKGFSPEQIVEACKPLNESSERIKDLLEQVKFKKNESKMD